MCPQALVDKWATPARQMFNTYGPTEATVSASLAELKAGEPVTIGQALPNYGLLVIEVIDPDSIVNGVVPRSRSCRSATPASCASPAPAWRRATSAGPI